MPGLPARFFYVRIRPSSSTKNRASHVRRNNFGGSAMLRLPPAFTLTAALFLIAAIACGADATATPAPSRSSQTSQSEVTSATPQVSTGEERVLKVAMTFLDEPPDPFQAGWLAMPTGISQTLFKLNESLKPEPWLATGATQAGSEPAPPQSLRHVCSWRIPAASGGRQ